MPHGSSQVIGLIEIENTAALGREEHPLRPERNPASRSAAPRVESFCPEEFRDVVEANLPCINDDLRRELAHFLARLANARVRH